MTGPCEVCGRVLEIKGLLPGRVIQHKRTMIRPGFGTIRMRCRGSDQPPRAAE